MRDGACRFKINDNAATMVFPNGVTLEFAKCPAGEFQMVYDFEQNKTAPVKITRPVWFSKTYVLFKHLAGAHPEDQGLQKCLTTPAGGRYYVQNPMVNIEQNLLPWLNVDFKRFFPKGYVVRLPSMAEFQYAYHANSKDRKDPYWLKNPTELSDEHNLFSLIYNGRGAESRASFIMSVCEPQIQLVSSSSQMDLCKPEQICG